MPGHRMHHERERPIPHERKRRRRDRDRHHRARHRGAGPRLEAEKTDLGQDVGDSAQGGNAKTIAEVVEPVANKLDTKSITGTPAGSLVVDGLGMVSAVARSQEKNQDGSDPTEAHLRTGAATYHAAGSIIGAVAGDGAGGQGVGQGVGQVTSGTGDLFAGAADLVSLHHEVTDSSKSPRQRLESGVRGGLAAARNVGAATKRFAGLAKSSGEAAGASLEELGGGGEQLVQAARALRTLPEAVREGDLAKAAEGVGKGVHSLASTVKSAATVAVHSGAGEGALQAANIAGQVSGVGSALVGSAQIGRGAAKVHKATAIKKRARERLLQAMGARAFAAPVPRLHEPLRKEEAASRYSIEAETTAQKQAVSEMTQGGLTVAAGATAATGAGSVAAPVLGAAAAGVKGGEHLTRYIVNKKRVAKDEELQALRARRVLHRLSKGKVGFSTEQQKRLQEIQEVGELRGVSVRGGNLSPAQRLRLLKSVNEDASPRRLAERKREVAETLSVRRPGHARRLRDFGIEPKEYEAMKKAAGGDQGKLEEALVRRLPDI